MSSITLKVHELIYTYTRCIFRLFSIEVLPPPPPSHLYSHQNMNQNKNELNGFENFIINTNVLF